MLVSFIIPAYNASETIFRCLDSIYNLPIEESVFEVIVIDDCSTDKTVELVKEYACGHSNLVLLCQPENHRQGAARNRGIAIAKGKYVVFVDSDDESSKGVIEAIRLAEENDLEMVVMRFYKVSYDGSVEGEIDIPYKQNKVFTGIEMQMEFPFWGTAPWPYVYRKSFLDKVSYPFAEDVLFEDSDFVNVHLYHAKRMGCCNSFGYCVHFNPISTTHTLSYKHLCDYALLGTRMLGFYDRIDDKSTKYAYGILEGGSYNIMKAFGKLFKLQSITEIRAFYDRFDAHFDRKKLLHYKEPSYCWTRSTRFYIRYRGCTMFIMALGGLFLRIAKTKSKVFMCNNNGVICLF